MKIATLAVLLALNWSVPNASAASDDALTPQQRAGAIEEIATQFEKIYVFPEVGKLVAQDLRVRLRRGEYEQEADSRKLAALLSAHIDAICNDNHTEVAYFENDQLATLPAKDPAAVKRQVEQRRAQGAAEISTLPSHGGLRETSH